MDKSPQQFVPYQPPPLAVGGEEAYHGVFEKWTCIFPGKMGLSWKLAWNSSGTKEEAEAQAAKNCNVVAVPVQLYEHIKDIEKRMVVAERTVSATDRTVRDPLTTLDGR